MSATPDAQNDEQRQLQGSKITFIFCPDCSNMLYAEEDTKTSTLMFTCRTCHHSEAPTSACVYRNELTNTVGETAGITKDLGQDPTVGEDFPPDMCTLCGREIVCQVCGKPMESACCLEVVDEDFETTVYGDAEQDDDVVSDPMSDDDDPEYPGGMGIEFIGGGMGNGHPARRHGQEQKREQHTQQTDSSASAQSLHLPRANKICPACGENEAVFFQSQQRTAETGMKLYFVCTKCGNVWQ